METEATRSEAPRARQTARAKQKSAVVEEITTNAVTPTKRAGKARKKEVEEAVVADPIVEAIPVAKPKRSTSTKKAAATKETQRNEATPEVVAQVQAKRVSIDKHLSTELRSQTEGVSALVQPFPASETSLVEEPPHRFGNSPDEQVALADLAAADDQLEAAVLDQMADEAIEPLLEADQDELWDGDDEELEGAESSFAEDGTEELPGEGLPAASRQEMPVPFAGNQSPLWWLATVKRGDRYHMITVQAPRAIQAITNIEESGGGQVLQIQADIPGLPIAQTKDTIQDNEMEGVGELPEIKRKKNSDSPLQSMDEAVTLLRTLQTHRLAKNRATKAEAPEQEILKVVIEYLEKVAPAATVPVGPAPLVRPERSGTRDERPSRYQPQDSSHSPSTGRGYQNETARPGQPGFGKGSRELQRGDERRPRPGYGNENRGKERWSPPGYGNDRNGRSERGSWAPDGFNRQDRNRSDFNRRPGERNERTFDRPFDRTFNRSSERSRSNSFTNDRAGQGRTPYRSSRPPEDRPERPEMNNRLRPPASQSFLPPPRLPRSPEDENAPRKDKKRIPPKE